MATLGVRPSGTVTFLFTDIEGSTKRWEADPDAMRIELAAHDEVLRAAVEGHAGWLFKHTGDGVCAAFASARNAVEAAVAAQRQLGLPVRMGIATGEAEQRGLTMFDSTIESFHHAGDVGNLAATLADLARFFDRYEQPEIAATVYGSTTAYTSTVMVANLPATVDHLRTVLGESRFDECVAAGKAMELAQAVQYAHRQIELTRRQLDAAQ